MSQESICLIRGSINVDEFFATPHIVRPGETLSSTSLTRRAGGKGANQAAAAARSAGGLVQLVGSVGQDGLWVKEQLASYGVGVDGVEVSKHEVTGRAIIQLTPEGENSIILHPGANHASLPLPASLPDGVSHLLLQNEIPLEQTLHYLSVASSSGISAIFNPSPMPTPDQIASFPWSQLAFLIVNEGELEDLLRHLPPSDSPSTSTPSSLALDSTFPDQIALTDVLLPSLLRLQSHPAFRYDASFPSSTTFSSPSLVLTLGPKGSLCLPSGAATLLYTPASKLRGDIRDTTGAGDCFAGYLAGGLMRSRIGASDLASDEGIEKLRVVLRTATQAAGLCVESYGAQEAIPTMDQVEGRLRALSI